MTRIRTRVGPILYPDGFAWKNINGAVATLPNNLNYVESKDVCNDDIGRGVDHPLSIVHRNDKGIRPLNGTRFDALGNPIRIFKDYTGEALFTLLGHNAVSLTSEADDITKALALSNPSRAVVSIPNFVHELKDLPGMFKDIVGFKSRILKPRGISAREVANHHLSLQMGWIPLVSDIKKLLHFSDLVDRRVNELERLYSNGGLKRRIKYGLGSASKEVVSGRTISSANSSTIGVVSRTYTTVTRWATVRWYPTSLPKNRTPESTRKLARQLVLGLHGLSPSQVWNAVPWTWLADWCTNTGTYLQATDNRIPCAHKAVNLMTKWETTEVLTRADSNPWCLGGDGTRTLVELKRTQGSPALTATLPFLSKRQLSILGALAIQRLR